ncbi:MAG: prepilin peptidase [Nanoarchaeota archaeon]
MLEVELILLVLAFIITIIAVISDIKTTEVPDYANYFLIFSALLLRVLYSITTEEWGFTTAVLFSFPIIFILASIMYKTRQWGGGDAKLLISLSIALATYPSFLLEFFSPKLVFIFPITLFINILIIGAMYSLVYTILMAIKNNERFLNQFRRIIRKTKKIQLTIFSIMVVIILFSFATEISKIFVIIISLSPIILFYVYIFMKTIEKVCLIKMIPVEKLIEGDLIIENVFHNKKIIHKINQELTKEQIKIIKKAGIEEVKIKQGVVFTPVFLLALIVSLIFGNLLLYFI